MSKTKPDYIFLPKAWFPASDVQEFIDECCVVGPEYSVTFSDLYEAFDAWRLKRNLRHWTGNRLALRLNALGYPNHIRNPGNKCTRYRMGLCLKGESEDED